MHRNSRSRRPAPLAVTLLALLVLPPLAPMPAHAKTPAKPVPDDATPKKVSFASLGDAVARIRFHGSIEVTGETKSLVYRQPLPADDDGQDILSVSVDPFPGLTHEILEQGEGRLLVLTWTDPPAGTLSYEVEIMVARDVFSTPVDDPTAGSSDAFMKPGTLTKPSAAVKKQAQALAAGAGTDLEAITRMAAWIDANVEYDPAYSQDKDDKAVGKVMEARRGTCDEISHLFISMARVAGVPAREVSGLAYTGAVWGFHSWSEVLLGSRWVPVDATNFQIGWVDATHVAFARDHDDAKFTQSIECMSTGTFEVLSHAMDVRIMKASTAKGRIEAKMSYEPASVPPGQPFTAKLHVENPTLSWIAGPARLVVPEGFTFEGGEIRTFVLQPHGEVDLSWKVKATATAEAGVTYTYRMGAVTSPQMVADADLVVTSGLIAGVDALLDSAGAAVTSVTLENTLGEPHAAKVKACSYGSWELGGEPACVEVETAEIPAGGKLTVEVATGHVPKGNFAIVVKATLGGLVDERVQKITVK